jgi:hypothetical protein
MNVLRIHHVAFAHPEGTDVYDVLTKVLNLPLVHTELSPDTRSRWRGWSDQAFH